jgi:NAD(P)-dependent dehydrogenase (short-subunit alcohol dehydrogenase family)
LDAPAGRRFHRNAEFLLRLDAVPGRNMVYNSGMDLHGKVALVTGSAKRVGKSVALELAAAGCNVAVHYNRSAEAAEQTVSEITNLGVACQAFPKNLAIIDEIPQLFREIREVFGRLDILVNNAAVYHRTPWQNLTAEQFDREMAVNARAPAMCIRHALDLMTDGAIINIVDIAADKPRAGFPAYCASKAALLALTGSAARALAPRIRVNAVSPGVALWPESAEENREQQVLSQVAMGRAGAPQDVAKAVAFLARHDYMTGQNLRVDGGWCMKQ